MRERLPEAYEILSSSHLTIHDAVRAVVLTGSRGLKGGRRPDSDIDLSLIVDSESAWDPHGRSFVLNEILVTTISTGSSLVELDTVAVFDKLSCGLVCFEATQFTDLRCQRMRPDCVGLYKTQKGFRGFVPAIGLLMESVYPMTTIWRSATAGACAVAAGDLE
jgi:predicted nucleotidyltransferase